MPGATSIRLDFDADGIASAVHTLRPAVGSGLWTWRSVAAPVRSSSGPRKLLLEDEPRHNLALGIASFTRDHPDLYAELRGWVVREDGDVVGAALRTPPYNLVLARPRTDRAVRALADAITDELPGVVGAVPEVDAFAAAWAARQG